MNSQLMHATDNDLAQQVLPTPMALKQSISLTPKIQAQVLQQSQAIQQLMNSPSMGKLLVVVGPCSLHDPKANLEFADRLAILAESLQQQLYIVMRAYIEKPRTTVGWKGMLYSPNFEDVGNIEQGLVASRQLMVSLAERGLPLATEILNPAVVNYFDDLVAWAAVGARTSESQIHRECASRLDCAVGFKNATNGSVDIALDAILAAQHQHVMISQNQLGQTIQLLSRGNPAPHLILRGGRSGVNYQQPQIEQIQQTIDQRQVHAPIIVDCSHANSQKQPLNQSGIALQILQQRKQTKIKGIMLESNLLDGHQPISADLTYGQSITDGCLGWEKTEMLLRQLAELNSQFV